jgi:adenosylhomocysteine nucleosidase
MAPTPGGGPRACRILILAALPLEVQPFLRQIRARPRAGLGRRAWEWEPGPGVAAFTGMGEAAARRVGAAMTEACRPGLLISAGFGGALTPGLAPGDLVLGAGFWRYDPEAGGLSAGPHPAPPRPLPLLTEALRRAGLRATLGSVVTTPRIIHKERQGGPLAGLDQPVLDLETAALAEVAAARGLRFLSLRAITDLAGEEIPGFLLGAGDRETTVGPGAVLRWLAGDVRRINDLLHLWRRSRGAAANLARGLACLWPLLVAAGGELQGQPGEEGRVDEDAHPAQAGLPDEEGHGEVKA